MPKKLNTANIVNELKGASLHFRKDDPAPTPKRLPAALPSPAAHETVTPAPEVVDTHASQESDTATPRHRDTAVSRHHGEQLDTIRKAVKQYGKEAATHRFTIDEKRALKQIEHDYLLQGIKTSENELTRIAINHLVEDYKAHKDKSIFAAVLKLLNS